MSKQGAPASFGRAGGPRQIFGLAVAAWLGAVCVLSPAASAQTVAEPALKAAFLFNFVKFATWPEDALPPGAPIVLCTSDNDVAGALEDLVTGRTVNDRPLVVKRVTQHASARGCSVLYAGRLDDRRAKELVTVLQGTSVLTVGEAEDFAVAGGMIGLFVADGHMKFAINVTAVGRTRLRLSSQLLNLAKIIKS